MSHRRTTRRTALLVAFLIATLLGACAHGNDEGATAGAKGAPAEDQLAGPLEVFAAASLTEAFTAIGTEFESAHPKVDVRFHFAGSSALVQQLTGGAPADVFAPADQASMASAVAAGRVAATSTIVARNRLALLVERGNPKGIHALTDLTRPGLVVVLCAPEVPCGKFAAAALTKAGVQLTPASNEENVKAVVAKVTLGEADAGIVYATDVRAAGDAAEGVAIAGADDPTLEAVYPMAAATDAPHPAVAAAWVDFVAGPAGRRALASYGFLAP